MKSLVVVAICRLTDVRNDNEDFELMEWFKLALIVSALNNEPTTLGEID